MFHNFSCSWMLTDPKSAHNAYSDCDGFTSTGTTAGEFAGYLAMGYMGLDQDWVTAMVDDYFAANPNGVVVLGNYTPRGRKRRGLRSNQRGPMFCIKLGTERHYFTEERYYRGLVTITKDRATVRCRCQGVNRAHVPVVTTIWPKAS
jgi:hypothetical protein